MADDSTLVTCQECGREDAERIEHAGETIYVHRTGPGGELHDYCISPGSGD